MACNGFNFSIPEGNQEGIENAIAELNDWAKGASGASGARSGSISETRDTKAFDFPMALQSLKDGTNDSLEEVVGLIGELESRISDLEARIARYNERSSHKI